MLCNKAKIVNATILLYVDVPHPKLFLVLHITCNTVGHFVVKMHI